MRILSEVDLQNLDLVNMDDTMKIELLEAIAVRYLELRTEFIQVSGRNAQLKAEMSLLGAAKSATQSALRAAARLAEG